MMNISIKFILRLGVGILLGGVLLYGCNMSPSNMCGNKIINEVNSPDQKNKIIIFVRDCGATTGFSTHVSVMNSEQSLTNEGGNLFSADAAHGKAPSGQDGELIVEVVWKDNDSVIIKHHNNVRIFRAENKVKDINIVYENN